MSPEDRERLVRMEEKLDGLTALVAPQLADHEKRIRAGERSRWMDRGALGVLVTMTGTFLYRFLH